jgi:hypothetical protein
VILKEYDIGWGPKWPMKQLEQQIIKQRLAAHYVDNSRTVIINSVWYTGDYHQQVMAELRETKPTHIFVVALLDPPIVQLGWFDELNCEVCGIGYYPGPGYIDYFAFFMDHYYNHISQDLLLDVEKIDTAYMCLNRKPHQHRRRLYQGLQDANLLDSGFVSMGGDPVPMRILHEDCEGQDIAPNGGTEQYGIANDIVSLGNINNWQRHLVNIVTETIWDIEPSNFLSEKTFKPILGLRPFLIYAPNGGVQCLHSRGFESYVTDFKDITDVDLQQPYNIPVFLSELCQQPASYWQMKFVKLKEKLVYNQQRFKDYAAQQKHIL